MPDPASNIVARAVRQPESDSMSLDDDAVAMATTTTMNAADEIIGRPLAQDSASEPPSCAATIRQFFESNTELTAAATHLWRAALRAATASRS
jgi:sugar diacid utilization regulator